MTTSEAFAVIGRPLAKVDVAGKTTGEAKYADDMSLPKMLCGRILRSIYPHAVIESVDVSRALAVPGVKAVLTGKDMPEKYGILPVSQDETALATDRVRYAGEPVAAVAATSSEAAEEALERIRVAYRRLESVTTIEEALDEKSEAMHATADGSNVQKRVNLEFGDLEAGFSQAEYVREDAFFYEGSNHVALEEQAVVASYGRDGRLTVWSSTQVPHYLHRTLEKVLSLPGSRIRVVVPTVGGGFGAKADIFSHELAAGKLSILTGRPVKISCTREEVFYMHRGRHPVRMLVRTGFKRDGKITAMHLKAVLDGGAYGSYGVATTYYVGALIPATYEIPNYKFEGARVFTNKPPCGAKRGHGTPQPRFAVECHLDKAAEELGIDPVELRLRNSVSPFSTTVNHLRITSCGLNECVARVVQASRFHEKRGRLGGGRGVGFAVSSYISGAGLPINWDDLPHSSAQVRVDREGGVTIYCMATDIGQGSSSVLSCLAAEVLGVGLSDVKIVASDTDLTPVDLGSYSSRVTFMAGNAVLQAATRMRALIIRAVAKRLGVAPNRLVARGGRVYCRDEPANGVSWTEAVRTAEARFGLLSSSGSYKPPKLAGPYKGSGVGPSPAYSYSACVAEVACDRETGQVNVEEVWLAHDIGRALNPLNVEGQIEGGVVMGLGEALMEEQAFRKGFLKSPSLLWYKVPTILEAPTIHPILVETIDPEGPLGAKEVGQGPLLPVAPAIANAVHDALGVRIDEVPITPDKVVRALKDKAGGGEGRVGPRGFPSLDFGEQTRVPAGGGAGMQRRRRRAEAMPNARVRPRGDR